MSNVNEELTNTSIIELPPELMLNSLSPRVFVCYGQSITEFELKGKQTIGRPDKNRIPDIPISDSHVSRNHGYFITRDGLVEYVAQETTNGVFLNGKKIFPTGSADIKDGDVITIPTMENGKRTDISLEFAFSPSKIEFWRNIRDTARDKLTGLYGRENFGIWWLNYLKQNESPNAFLFFIDIDDFKAINDTNGHETGDQALFFLAGVLKNAVGNEEQLCRWGGDEFVGIIPGDIESVKEKLSGVMKSLDSINTEKNIYMTLSIGLVDISGQSEITNIYYLASLADKALYRAKELGKNNIFVYEEDL
ncbi:MAG: GGDEF domain-containing protein [Lachnospiraceae bacterium]|nr:GGDEF domain-containing protein [Lachnospiraceae bacterium]